MFNQLSLKENAANLDLENNPLLQDSINYVLK